MCCLFFLTPYSVVIFDNVIPKEEHKTMRPISKFNILYFFYITIRKIQ